MHQSTVVLYHYFDFRDNTGSKCGYSGFLLNLIQQMGSNGDGIHHALQNLYNNSKQGLLHCRPSNTELEKTLDTIIQELNIGCIVLDAMDECGHKDTVHVLNWLSGIRTKLCIAVTSRYVSEARALSNLKLKVTLDSAQPGMNKDIALYLNEQMQNHAFGDFQYQIVETLMQKAEGQ